MMETGIWFHEEQHDATTSQDEDRELLGFIRTWAPSGESDEGTLRAATRISSLENGPIIDIATTLLTGAKMKSNGPDTMDQGM